MVRHFLNAQVRRWPWLLEAIFHQHDHDQVVGRAIAFVFGERYRVIVRRCRCGHQVQMVECAEQPLRAA